MVRTEQPNRTGEHYKGNSYFKIKIMQKMEKYELNIKVEPTKEKLTCVHRKIIQSTYVTFGAEVPVAKRTLARKLEILTRIGMCKEGYYQNDQGPRGKKNVHQTVFIKLIHQSCDQGEMKQRSGLEIKAFWN